MSKKTFIGVVVSDKMEKTVVVSLERFRRHPRYQKLMRRHIKVKAHDTFGAKTGSRVKIVEGRPRSKEKRWRVIEVLEE